MARILIVEDDRPFADALALTLRLEGHDVLVAVGADEGIELGLAHRPDVVIADWLLQDHLHGGEVCRQIRAACPPAKCIVMTGYPDALPEVARRCKHTVAVIAKPFHKEDILAAVNGALSGAAPVVYIVDDDPQVCESLSMMVRSAGLGVETYPSAEAFLDGFQNSPERPKCMVLDVRMPGLSGLGLQQALAAQGRTVPTIMISGCADIPMAVQAMSEGAMDFLEKPFNRRTLLARIQEAIERDAQRQRETARSDDLAARVETLSSRQRQVFDLLVAGKYSKQIAGKLGIGEKTVAKHRACVLEKMQVDNVVELVRLMAETNHG